MISKYLFLCLLLYALMGMLSGNLAHAHPVAYTGPDSGIYPFYFLFLVFGVSFFNVEFKCSDAVCTVSRVWSKIITVFSICIWMIEAALEFYFQELFYI